MSSLTHIPGKKERFFLISFLQESRKTTGPLYLYLNLHQTIFIWNHCLENFLQGGKHYNLFLNAFCFKLIFTRLFLTLSCYFPEGRVEILMFLSTVEHHFLEKFEVFLYFFKKSFSYVLLGHHVMRQFALQNFYNLEFCTLNPVLPV